MALFRKLTRKAPKMWGPSMVGYGSQQYTYESGRTGEMPLACFAIRGRDLVVYLYAEGTRQKALLSKVGKHKMGKSCMYFRQLADLDKSVLEQLVTSCIAEVRRRYPSWTLHVGLKSLTGEGAVIRFLRSIQVGIRSLRRSPGFAVT